MENVQERHKEIETEALRWLIRLDRERSPETEAAHAAWMARSPIHQVAFAKQRIAWMRMDSLRRMRPLDGHDADPDLLRPKRKRFPWINTERVVAVLATALVCTVIFGLVSHWRADAGTPYVTGVGAQERAILSDGTVIHLNTDTRVRVKYTADHREIRLERGELMVSVAHDPSRPLDVIAADVTSRAVGTRFSVRLHGNSHVETLVAEGRVRVLRDQSVFGIPLWQTPLTHTLQAGERVVVGRDSADVSRATPKEVSRSLMWSTGTISFEGERLQDVVNELNRYTVRQLVIRDPGIADMEIGGAFNTANAEAYAVDLSRFFGARALPLVGPEPN